MISHTGTLKVLNHKTSDYNIKWNVSQAFYISSAKSIVSLLSNSVWPSHENHYESNNSDKKEVKQMRCRNKQTKIYLFYLSTIK